MDSSSAKPKMYGVKYPPELIQKLDRWVDELNRTRRTRVSRSALIVGVLDWACDARPDWEHKPAGDAPPSAPAADPGDEAPPSGSGPGAFQRRGRGPADRPQNRGLSRQVAPSEGGGSGKRGK